MNSECLHTLWHSLHIWKLKKNILRNYKKEKRQNSTFQKILWKGNVKKLRNSIDILLYSIVSQFNEENFFIKIWKIRDKWNKFIVLVELFFHNDRVLRLKYFIFWEKLIQLHKQKSSSVRTGTRVKWSLTKVSALSF